MPQQKAKAGQKRQYRKKYSPEFKQQIVELCQVEGTVKRDVIERYGISEGLLYEWIHTYKKYGTFDRTKIKESRLTQIERLEKRIEHLELENSILKDVALMLENFKQKNSDN